MCFKNWQLRQICFLLITVSIALIPLLYSGCCRLLSTNRERAANTTEGKEESERKERSARCAQEKEALQLLDSKANEFSRLPKRKQLVAQPYVKGKLYMIELREVESLGERAFTYEGAYCRVSAECQADASCSGADKFREIRARSIDEVQTVAIRTCHKVKRGDYVQTSGSNKGENVPGYDLACELVLVDRTIPAVVHKKTFESELLMLEDQSRMPLTGKRELVARAPDDEMDSVLLGLPRK